MNLQLNGVSIKVEVKDGNQGKGAPPTEYDIHKTYVRNLYPPQQLLKQDGVLENRVVTSRRGQGRTRRRFSRRHLSPGSAVTEPPWGETQGVHVGIHNGATRMTSEAGPSAAVRLNNSFRGVTVLEKKKNNRGSAF